MANEFVEVAKKLADGAAPDWLVERLGQYVFFIGNQKKYSADGSDVKTLAAIATVEAELRVFGEMQERFPFLEIPDCVDRAANALFEFRQFLERLKEPDRKGGPTPDKRRFLCACVCAGAWKELHGKVQPLSSKLQEACEAYWLACGQSETSAEGRIRNWERHLIEYARNP